MILFGKISLVWKNVLYARHLSQRRIKEITLFLSLLFEAHGTRMEEG
jgi:hypothetical protein